MNYYYPGPGVVVPTQLPSASPVNPGEKNAMYGGSAPAMATAMPYPQPNSLTPGIAGPPLLRPSQPAAASVPTYVPSSAAGQYQPSIYHTPAGANPLYASATLAYCAQPHLTGHSSATPSAQLPNNPYIAAQPVPSRYPASVYSGAHIITTSAGVTPYAGSAVYRTAPPVSSPTAFHPSVYPPAVSGVSPIQVPLSSYPSLNPNGPPLIGAAPAYTAGVAPVFTPRM
ncbi:hypothetical protein LSH36_502g01004 [Paralvinella palmiformis]|uniref:Uncharacterized protein n=1 Tax=Paralvinella palmiformis TaxID=53620 RepID=A0AAD9MWH4_9ANNE|nr:hypothetical protein LSH36_502g01004 [Paralvinella palmiformis]